MSPTDPTQARLRWRCRRGMRELDVLLTGFFDTQYAQLDPDTRRGFEELLMLPDPEIYALLLGRNSTDNVVVGDVVKRLLAES